MSSPIIVVEHVSKYYKQRRKSKMEQIDSSAIVDPTQLDPERGMAALRDVSFSIKSGQATGFVGHNGAGKSTMLRMLAGITKPDSGRIEVHGRTSALLTLKASVNPHLTGRENIYLYGALMGFHKEEIDTHLDEIVTFSELGYFIDEPVATYSSGMGARLAFSASIMLAPDIFLVDEVLAVGDPAFQAQALQRMRRLFEGGSTVVFVSHNINAVRSLCQKIIWFKHGRIHAIGPTEEVLAAYLSSESQPSESEAKGSITSLETLNALGRKRRRFPIGEVINVNFNYTGLVSHHNLIVEIYDPIQNEVVLSVDARQSLATNEIPPFNGSVMTMLDGIMLPPRLYHLRVLLKQDSEDNRTVVDRQEISLIVYDPDEHIGSSTANVQMIIVPH